MSDQFDPYHVWLGIPPEEQPPNHYRLLGLRPLESDRDVISNALDQRLVFLRTFQAGKRGPLSQKLLNEVSAAGVVLLNAEKKAQYDRQLPAPPEAGKSHKPLTGLPVAKPILEAFPPAAAVPDSVLPLAPAENVIPGLPTSSRSDWEAHASFPQQAQAPGSIPGSQPANTSDWQPAAVSRPGNLPSRKPQQSGLPAAVVIGGGIALAVLAGLLVGGLWLASQQVATVDPPRPPDHDWPVVSSDRSTDRNDKPDNGNSNAGPGASDKPTSDPPPDTVPPKAPGDSIARSASAASATSRQIWLADAPVKRVLRNTSTGWIDFRERDEFHYQQRFLSRDSVGLWDSVRQFAIDLYEDRLEVHSPTAAPAVVCKGRWISEDELPEFAKREPVARRPGPLAWRSSNWSALVFDGNSSISLPVPPELATPGADFTIEMWVRFETGFPDSRLITALPLELRTMRPRAEGPSSRSILMADLKSGPLGIGLPVQVQGGKWHHWAVVRDGPTLRLFVDGQPRAPLPVEQSFVIKATQVLLGGRDDNSPKLRGLVRDLRISKGARYSGVFRPPLRFVKDEKTLLLPKFEAAAGPTIEDLSGRGHTAQRNTSQWLPLTEDEGFVQAELPGGRVDLMRAFTSSLHTVRGTSERTVSEAATTSGSGITQVIVPLLAPSDFNLELELTREAGDGGALFGVVLGPEAKPAAIAIDALANRGGPYSGILPADLQTVAAATSLSKHAPKLVTGQRHRVHVQVRTLGIDRVSLNVAIDGQVMHSAADALANVAISPSLSLPQPAALFWGSYDAKVRFHSMRLIPVTGRGSIAAATNVGPRPAPPMPRPPGDSGSPMPANANPPTSPATTVRLPVPAADELAQRVEVARSTFQDQFKQATRPAQKVALAQRILATAEDTQSDPVARYVLRDLARKVFVQAGEVKQSLEAARSLEKEFDVPQNQMVLTTLEALDDGTLPSEERATLAKTAIELADELVAADDFAQAEKVATIASQSASKQRDAELRKDITQRRAQIARVAAAAKPLAASLVLVQTMPDDPAANLAVGKFHCFVLEDWETGVPQLAKSNDPLLAPPARLDAAAQAGKAADQVAAGEAWLKLAGDAKAVSKDDRPAVLARARELLTQAQAGLDGLEKVRVEKLVAEMPAATASARRASKSRSPKAQAGSGLIGRVSVRNRDAGILVTYQPGYRISDADVTRLAAAAGVNPGDSWRIDFVGVLSLAGDCQVESRHIGGSANGGVHSLFIDNQRISEIGDDRSKNDTSRRSFQGGAHAIRWVLTGGDLGTASIEFTPLNNAGQPVAGAHAVHYTREMNAAARQTAVRSEFHFGM